VLRTALFVAVIVVASPVHAEVPQPNPEGMLLDTDAMLDVKCATPEERSAAAQQLNSKIDWFLSRIEVPADMTEQLDNAADFRSFITHPWGNAHLFRLSAPDLKSRLASLVTETHRETRLKESNQGLWRQFRAGTPAVGTRQDQSRPAHR
jgi:hypothetical protein